MLSRFGIEIVCSLLRFRHDVNFPVSAMRALDRFAWCYAMERPFVVRDTALYNALLLACSQVLQEGNRCVDVLMKRILAVQGCTSNQLHDPRNDERRISTRRMSGAHQGHKPSLLYILDDLLDDIKMPSLSIETCLFLCPLSALHYKYWYVYIFVEWS
ncbi:hypothetical protein CUC08_Gglean006583 [Alternaria sp. MG1]|nr:hypothetical protein CUC08_Gglean006583 [Alternaria sp. MG1]